MNVKLFANLQPQSVRLLRNDGGQAERAEEDEKARIKFKNYEESSAHFGKLQEGFVPRCTTSYIIPQQTMVYFIMILAALEGLCNPKLGEVN